METQVVGAASGVERGVRLGRRLLCAGAAVLVLSAALHTVAMLAPQPAPPDADGVKMLELMHGYTFHVAGSTLTMEGLLRGFNWYFSLALAFQGLVTVLVARARPADGGLLRLVAWLGAASLAAGVTIAVLYFPLPPSALLGLALACYGGAGVALRAI